MRKDLKIGMAIGAVLLVLVVVFLVTKPKEGTELAAGDGSGGGGNTEVDASAGQAPDAGGEIDADAEQSEPAAPRDAEPAEPQAPAGAREAAVADASKANDVFDDSPDAPAIEGEEVADAGDGGGTNWDKLLNSGGDGKLPSLMLTRAPSVRDRDAVGVRNGGSTVGLAVGATGGAPAGADDLGTGTGALAAPTAPQDQPRVTGSATVSGGVPDRAPAAAPAPSGDDNSAAAAPIPTEQDTRTGRTHVMKKGETYPSIAKARFGDSRHYLAIEKANPDLDPTRIRPGTVINLPDLATIKAAGNGGAARAEARPVDPKTEYEVKSGDSLHRIAEKRYGTSTMAAKIYELNLETIGPDESKLKLGTVLKMPPNPNATAETEGGAGGSGSDTSSNGNESASR